MRQSALRPVACRESVPLLFSGCVLRSSRQARLCVRPYWRTHDAKHGEACANLSASPTCLAIDRRDLHCSTDTVCAVRRVPKLHQLDDPCPQITSPSRQPIIVFLPPFAMCPAFPDSDYYEGSVLERVHLRSSRLARFLPSGRLKFPCSDFQPVCL
jgi:hypothetical protein